MPKSRETRNEANQLFNALRLRTKVVDLAPELHHSMPVWDTHPDAVIIREARNHAQHGYFAQSLLISEHTGAHVDAPHHFHENMPESTVDRYDPDQIMGIFKVVDFRFLEPKAGELLSASHVQEALARTDSLIEADEIVLLNFGWSQHYQPDNADPDVRQWWAKNAPGLDESACALLHGFGIRAIGSDTVACDVAVLDGVMLSDFGHRLYFLPNDIPIIEGLANLDELPATGVFIATPLRIRGGSGSPIRPIALVEA